MPTRGRKGFGEFLALNWFFGFAEALGAQSGFMFHVLLKPVDWNR